MSLAEEAYADPLVSLLPHKFGAAHWHGDVFEIPSGGVRMASTELTSNQIFHYSPKVYAFQFHLEMTPALFEELVRDSENYLVGEGVETESLIREAYEVLPLLEKSARAFFAKWASLL